MNIPEQEKVSISPQEIDWACEGLSGDSKKSMELLLLALSDLSRLNNNLALSGMLITLRATRMLLNVSNPPDCVNRAEMLMRKLIEEAENNTNITHNPAITEIINDVRAIVPPAAMLSGSDPAGMWPYGTRDSGPSAAAIEDVSSLGVDTGAGHAATWESPDLAFKRGLSGRDTGPSAASAADVSIEAESVDYTDKADKPRPITWHTL